MFEHLYQETGYLQLSVAVPGQRTKNMWIVSQRLSVSIWHRRVWVDGEEFLPISGKFLWGWLVFASPSSGTPTAQTSDERIGIPVTPPGLVYENGGAQPTTAWNEWERWRELAQN